MKSIKKRFKLLLADIKQSADELALLSSDLPLLSNIQRIANSVLNAEKELSRKASKLDKKEFIEGIADAEELSELEAIVDIDAISGLEDRFFAELADQDGSSAGDFFQQLLEKIDKSYTRMIEDIQQLSALPDEE